MKYSSIVACAVFGLAALAPQTATCESVGVAIVKTDGTTHHVVFEDIDRIEIGSGSVTVHHATSATTTHDMADIERIDIGVSGLSSGIADAVAEGSIAVWPTVVESSINIAGAVADTTVNVFSINGRNVASAKTDADGSASVNLAGLPAGHYIVAVGAHTVKIVKK